MFLVLQKSMIKKKESLIKRQSFIPHFSNGVSQAGMTLFDLGAELVGEKPLEGLQCGRLGAGALPAQAGGG